MLITSLSVVKISECNIMSRAKKENEQDKNFENLAKSVQWIILNGKKIPITCRGSQN